MGYFSLNAASKVIGQKGAKEGRVNGREKIGSLLDFRKGNDRLIYRIE